MSYERPAKRIRQACEQCRRKKSKCSGEKPVCSTCWRLEQQCYYNGEPLQPIYDYGTSIVHNLSTVPHPAISVRDAHDSHNLGDRMITLESTVNRILSTLQPNGVNDQTRTSALSSPGENSTHDSVTETTETAGTAAPSLTALIGNRPESRQMRLVKRRELEDIGKAYVAFCADQPLPLFPREAFVESLVDRVDITLFAIIANALRFIHDERGPSCAATSQAFRDAAHSLAMTDIGQGNVDIATLQGLCLIVLFDFKDGRTTSASTLMALTSTFASVVNLRAVSPGSCASQEEEIKCCYWSITLLRRLLGMTTPLAIAPDARSLPHPKSCFMPTGSVLRPEIREVYERSVDDPGVMAFIIEMSEEWVTVMSYVRNCLAFTADVSPWLTTSRYAAALAGVMNIETRLQSLHRYKHVTFRDLTLEDLEKCRQYWAPWLLSRFLYHTMICLLNHPLLITMQLQAQGNDSELFRQQSSFYVARHVRWILHFIAFIEARGFRVTDPILGYCAAVVATIESQLIYSVDEATAQKKRRNIDSCRRLIRSLARSVPSMLEMDQKLGSLEETISATYESNVKRTASVSVDVARIREILDVCSSPPIKAFARLGLPSALIEPQGIETSDLSPSQWIRLSRRPSVDQPDESVLPAQDEVERGRHLPVEMHQDATEDIASRLAPLSTSAPLPIETPGFPADLFFNGISQDASSWWNAFDTYDPDCPSF